MKKTIALLAAGACVAGYAVSASSAQATTTTITGYVVDGTGAGDGTLNGYASNLQPETAASDYYWYQDLAIGIWDSDPQGAESWGGDVVNLVNAPACPAKGDYCIYVSTADLTSLNECAYGSVYAPGKLAAGDGYRGYIVLGSNCSGYTQEQRISITTHELGHAQGIPFDGSGDPTDLMTDVGFPSVQVPDYAQFQDVGEYFASGGTYQSNAH